MKRGLVIEGGGMRGAHSCGALMAMHEMGMTFDVVAASSAGACTGAFWVSGQHNLFRVIWGDHLNGTQFISLKNFFKRQHIMNLDYLIDVVFAHKEKLDIEAIRNSPTKLFISSTNCMTGNAHYFSNDDLILPALKASAAMPVAYRNPVWIDGIPYRDGGIADPIPIQKAIDEGCDEIVVVLTRPENYRKKPSYLMPWLLKRQHFGLAQALIRRHETYNKTAEAIEKNKFSAKITVIRPTRTLPVKRLSTTQKNIFEAIQQGQEDARAILLKKN